MTIPAVVTILDLATAAAASTGMWLEASFTTGSVATTNRISLAQIMSTNLGALPTGGATGQLLTKSSGSDFATQWSNISSLITVNATSSLQLSGSTTIALALASVAGLSVLGTNTSATTIPLPITAATGAQVLRANDQGTGVAFGAVNLASAASVTGVLPGANMSAVNLATTGAGGVTGVLPVPNGGSGTATLTANAVLKGAGTSAIVASGVSIDANNSMVASSGTSSTPLWVIENTSNNATEASYRMAKSRSGGLVQSGDSLGSLAFVGFDGSAYQFGALIGAAVDGTAASGDMPSRLQFYTVADGTTALSERMRINNSGAVSIGTTNGLGTGTLQVAGRAAILSSTAFPSGGATTMFLNFSSATTFGIYCGTGTPTVAAATGSIYLRSDGVITSLGPYINVNGATSWVTGQPGAVLLNTITPSGVATAGDTTSLTSTYRSYLVVMDNVLPATNTNTLQMQFSTSAGAAFIAANYVNATASTTVIDLTGTDISTSAGGGVCGEVRIFNPAGTAAFKAVRGNSTYVNNAGTAAGQGAAGLWIGTATLAVNGFQVKFASGNIATGTIKVYGFI